MATQYAYNDLYTVTQLADPLVAATTEPPSSSSGGGDPVLVPSAERRHHQRRSLLGKAADAGAPVAGQSSGGSSHSIVKRRGYLVPTDHAYKTFKGSMPRVHGSVAHTSLFKNAHSLGVSGDGSTTLKRFLKHHMWQEISELPMTNAATNMSRLLRTTTVVKLRWMDGGDSSGIGSGARTASVSTSASTPSSSSEENLLESELWATHTATAGTSALDLYPEGGYASILAGLKERASASASTSRPSTRSAPDTGANNNSSAFPTTSGGSGGSRRSLKQAALQSCSETQMGSSGRQVSLDNDGDTMAYAHKLSSSSSSTAARGSGIRGDVSGNVMSQGKGLCFGYNLDQFLITKSTFSKSEKANTSYWLQYSLYMHLGFIWYPFIIDMHC